MGGREGGREREREEEKGRVGEGKGVVVKGEREGEPLIPAACTQLFRHTRHSVSQTCSYSNTALKYPSGSCS